MTITPAHVRAVADAVGLPLTDEECAHLVPRLAAYREMGLAVADAVETDELPTDDPRWPDDE